MAVSLCSDGTDVSQAWAHGTDADPAGKHLPQRCRRGEFNNMSSWFDFGLLSFSSLKL